MEAPGAVPRRPGGRVRAASCLSGADVSLPAPLPSSRAALVAAGPEDECAWLEFLACNAAWRRPFVEWVARELERLRDEDPQRTLALAECCLRVADLSGDEWQRGLAQRGRAWALHHLSRFEEAQESYEAAAAAFRAAGDDLQVARTSIGAVWLLRYFGRYDEALALAQEARPVLQAAGAERDVATLDLNVATVYRRQGLTRRALELNLRCAAVFARLREDELEATSLMNAANALRELDELPAALAAYQRAAETYQRLGRRALASTLYTNLGELYQKMGRFDDALRTLAAAMRAARGPGLEREAAFASLALAVTYASLNLAGESLEHNQRALESFRRLHMPWEEAYTLFRAAELHERIGHRQVAGTLALRASTMFTEQGNHPWAGAAQGLLAATAVGAGRSAQLEALRLCRLGQRALREAGWRLREGIARQVEGDLLQALGRTAAAERAYRAVLRLSEALGVSSLAFSANERLGRLLRARDPEAALAHYNTAIQHLEQSRGALPALELRQGFVADKARLFEDVVRLQLRRRAPGTLCAAFEAAERSKSRALLDELGRDPERERPTAGKPATGATLSLAGARERLRWEYSKLDQAAARSPAEMRRQRERLRQLEAQLDREARELALLRGDSPSTTAGVVGLHDFRARLSPEDVVLEYFAAADELMCFEITRSRVEVHRSIASYARVQDLAGQLRFQMSRFAYGPPTTTASMAGWEETQRPLLHALYESLLGSLPTRWRGRRVTIVPHGALHSVPFHALWDGTAYAVRYGSFAYAPSASVLVRLGQRPRRPLARALLVAPDDPLLPGAQREVQRLAELLSSPTVLAGPLATAARFRRHAPRADVVHLATHAVFRSDNPSFSTLKLAGSWLLLRDVVSLGLSASLAVLSACETGQVAIRPGDELLGLSHGFFQAGCRTLVASLWPVDDASAADLMEVFYRRLLAGDDVAESLRQARLALMESHPHPYFWAPFVAMGLC